MLIMCSLITFMFIVFSPYSFLYLSLYYIFMFSLLQTSSFYMYWAIIEVLILIFIGLSYSFITSSYSQLIVYFLIQTVASFMILVFYLYDMSSLLTAAFVINLSIFPFYGWYLNVLYRLPNFVFWLASTLHNIPPLIIINVFSLSIDFSLFWLSIIFTTLLMGFIILSLLDFRMLLVLSSIGNNSWLFISQLSSFFLFLVYFIIYSISLYFVLIEFGGLSKFSFSNGFTSSNSHFSFWVLTLSGMPPFPLFYLKILVVLSLFYIFNVNYLFVLFLFSSSLMFMSYLRSLISFFVYVYTSIITYLFNL